MNTYKKYCPNVFLAQCEKEYKKGDVIIVVTKYGKENECVVHNFVGYTGTKEKPFYCYSITRLDGFSSQSRAEQKLKKLNYYASKADERGGQWREKSNEGKDFLALAEPIKIGHHSEKRHRALIERNWNRMSNAIKEFEKAEVYRERMEFWEQQAKKIDLSMPESLEFFKIQLEEAEAYQQGLKQGTIKRSHSYSLTYATKKVKELKNKLEIAQKLWA